MLKFIKDLDGVEVLSRESQRHVKGGVSELEYCASLYIIKACNEVEDSFGWATGWSLGNCQQKNATALYEEAESQLDNPSDLGNCQYNWLYI